MSSPTNRGYFEWQKKSPADDYLQLKGANGSVVGGIDGNGVRYGSLAGGGGSASGPLDSVQFNASGLFAGDANFLWVPGQGLVIGELASFNGPVSINGPASPSVNLFQITDNNGLPIVWVDPTYGDVALELTSNVNGANAIDCSIRLHGSDGVGVNIDLDRRVGVDNGLDFAIENPAGNFILGALFLGLDVSFIVNQFDTPLNPVTMAFFSQPGVHFGSEAVHFVIFQGDSAADSDVLVEIFTTSATRAADYFRIEATAHVFPFRIDKTGALRLNVATPTVDTGEIGFGNTTGFGNGSSGQGVVTTLTGTGTGPTTPTTVVNYLKINLGGSDFWAPLVQ